MVFQESQGTFQEINFIKAYQLVMGPDEDLGTIPSCEYFSRELLELPLEPGEFLAWSEPTLKAWSPLNTGSPLELAKPLPF